MAAASHPNRLAIKNLAFDPTLSPRGASHLMHHASARQCRELPGGCHCPAKNERLLSLTILVKAAVSDRPAKLSSMILAQCGVIVGAAGHIFRISTFHQFATQTLLRPPSPPAYFLIA